MAIVCIFDLEFDAQSLAERSVDLYFLAFVFWVETWGDLVRHIYGWELFWAKFVHNEV